MNVKLKDIEGLMLRTEAIPGKVGCDCPPAGHLLTCRMKSLEDKFKDTISEVYRSGLDMGLFARIAKNHYESLIASVIDRQKGLYDLQHLQGERSLTLNREKLALKIYAITMRHLASKEEVKSQFELHHITWNPTVNEAWIKADSIIASLPEIIESVTP